MNSKLLIEESPLQVLPSLAVALDSLNDGIFLQQLHWLINNSGQAKMADGKKWIRRTAEEWKQTTFQFWSAQTIARVIASLAEKKVITTRHDLNEYKGDRTTWVTIDYAELNSLLAKGDQPFIENDKCSIENDKPFDQLDDLHLINLIRSMDQLDKIHLINLIKSNNDKSKTRTLEEREKDASAQTPAGALSLSSLPESDLPDWLKDQPLPETSPGALSLSPLPESNPKEEQDHAPQQETPIPLVAVVPLSPVAQALASAANAAFESEDTQAQPGEYLPGLKMPVKPRSARLAAENIASARKLGIDERTFRLMVDALLTGTGKMLVANGRSEDAEKVHRQAQESILEIIGYSVTTYPDETAIAKLVKSYKSYNGWQTQPPSNLQIMTHAARVVSGDVSLAGLPQQTQGQPSRSNIPAGHQPAPAQYAHMNAFAKRITAGHVGEK